MKKFALGFTACVILAAAIFFSYLFPRPTQAPIVNAFQPNYYDNEIKFDNGGFSALRTNGIFIVRNPNPTSDGNYYGLILIGSDIRELDFEYFRFEAVKEIGGKWYTAREYASELRGTPIETIHSVGEWFEIPVDEFTREPNVFSAEFVLPIKSVAGKYGVRARAVYPRPIYDGSTTTEYVPYEDENDYNSNGITDEPVDFFFIILYGDDYQYVRCVDNSGDTVHLVTPTRRQVRINVSSNEGAMRKDMLVIKTNNFDNFTAGTIEAAVDIFWADLREVTVEITLNSQKVNFLKPVWRESGIDITLPNKLPVGKYLVTIYNNEYKPELIGTYVIDNGNFLPANTVRNSGIIVLVLGAIGFFCGFIMVLGPQFAYLINKNRYKAIDARIYKTDAKSVRKAEKEKREKEKAIKEGKIEREIDESRSFSAKLESFRNKRAEAKRLGLSMEEYSEIERKQGIRKTIDKFNTADARRVIGGGSKITEDLTEKKPLAIQDGSPELDIVESVKMEGLLTTDQFATAGIEVRDDAIKPIDAIEKGILGRIKNFLDEHPENN